MTRRSFLRAIGIAATAVALAPAFGGSVQAAEHWLLQDLEPGDLIDISVNGERFHCVVEMVHIDLEKSEAEIGVAERRFLAGIDEFVSPCLMTLHVPLRFFGATA